MNLQRLKFAYARGARIQKMVDDHWTSVVPNWYQGCTWRIHPDDARLAYGPLSTALRERNELTAFAQVLAETLFMSAEERADLDGVLIYNGPLYEMWDDICAEALADEGL